ncbi:NAD-binding protein [Phyllobacterium endophyticum]|uniref:3-hydroxyisobutyrate dehydrogenase-like NAD-binding domain-containing protein n=1 Tax=Phyllobacterium endophyticum TaxID=1149773 RepID=A0A2P7AS08_9HYPH|nr:hypothetical protein CU100_17185 [Phyllobacterium endophyticum]TYR39740.1 NAD-binding protein [Phyllobacterium endophyticum]
MELHQKDLNNALDAARKLKSFLPATALAQQLFSACSAGGGSALDHSAVVRVHRMLGDKVPT